MSVVKNWKKLLRQLGSLLHKMHFLDSARARTWTTTLLVMSICGWIALLFAESSGPPAEFITKVEGIDKLAHFSAFGVLGLLVCALSFHLRPRKSIPLLSLPLFVVGLTGMLEESYQLCVPGRMGSLPDFVADVLGAVFAIVVANRLAAFKRSFCRLHSES